MKHEKQCIQMGCKGPCIEMKSNEHCVQDDVGEGLSRYMTTAR